MGTYKVIQDIESEDKIIGWMTPRQTIYAAIVLVSLFVWFMFFSAGAWWLGFILLPHIILFTVLAGPFVHDQPSEVWLLAKIKFALVPRKRIWDQTGIQELVTITVPKKVERVLTDGLSQREVKSRLEALASTIDSRGWAIKNAGPMQPVYAGSGSDRLVDHSAMPVEVPDYDTSTIVDVLDTATNPTAQHMQQMVAQSAAVHKQQIMAQMQQPQIVQQPPVNNQWFIDPAAAPQPQQQATQSEEAIFEQIQKQKAKTHIATSHMANLSPISSRPVAPKSPQNLTQTKPLEAHTDTRETPAPKNPVVEQLAQNNDLNIATIARQAKKPSDDGEVVISLR